MIAIDIDSDDEVEPFLTANPKLVGSLRTKGKRGCQIWLRMRGEYPESKILSGLKKGKAAAIEWRGGGGHQSVLWGVHPKKMRYTFLVESPAIEICFEEINWPAHHCENALRHHGHAGPAFVRKLIEVNVDLQLLLDVAMEEFSVPDAHRSMISREGQLAFAVMGLAGELATSWDCCHGREERRFKAACCSSGAGRSRCVPARRSRPLPGSER